MEAFSESDHPLTEDTLAEIGGQNQWKYRLQRFARWTDNLVIVRDPSTGAQTMSYVDPHNHKVPTPIHVQIEQAQQVVEQSQDVSQDIRWPDAPPFIESMGEKFREPTWFNNMRVMVKNGRHIALAGPPGVGKDTAVQELAASEGKTLVTVGGDAGFRRRDLIGSPQIVRGTSYIEIAEYTAAVTNGWWALISEVNAADADALMFLNTQLAPPYAINIAGTAYPVHPDFRLFVTYNPGLVGTKPLPQSFKDRFFSIQIPFFNRNQLRSILTAHGMPDTDWANVIVGFGMELWGAHERGQIRYQVTSRRLQDAVVLMTCGLYDNPIDALSAAVIAAIDSPIEAQVAKRILEACHG
jgi:hypothetical protein